MRIFVISLIILSFNWAMASLRPKRKLLYDCVYLKDNSQLERVYIYQSRFGSARPFHEFKIFYLKDGYSKNYFKKVRLNSQYDGKILHFSNGNTRIKIDKVRVKEGKYWTFGRIPKFKVHSFDWACKDAI